MRGLLWIVMGVVVIGLGFLMVKQPGVNPKSAPTASPAAVHSATATPTAAAINTVSPTAVPTSAPTAALIEVQNMAFEPNTISVTLGQPITIVNKDTVTHSFTADDNSFDSGPIPPDSSKTVTITSPGTFGFHCAFYPNVNGTVTVQ